MLKSDVLLMFDHVYWMRDRILDAAERDDMPLVEPHPVTERDLRATLVHELDVEWSWRERLGGADPTTFDDAVAELEPADYPTVAAIRQHWQRDEAEMRAWLDTLTDDRLAGPCGAEQPPRHPLWFHLQHLYTHAVQQFGDAAVLVSAAGHSPGNLDFLEFAERRDSSA